MIGLHHDRALRCFVISMPDPVALEAVEQLRVSLFAALGPTSDCALLIDTHRHDFESIACLEALRDLLEAPEVVAKCARVAFVAPRQYRQPHIASEREAYFDNVADARVWLERFIND